MSIVLTPPEDGAHLASHALIYRGTMEHWQSGILLGNGDTGVVAYQPAAALCYGITRAGLFDTRNPMQVQKTHREIRELWQSGRLDEILDWDRQENAHYHRQPYPTPRAAGVLTVEPGRSIASLRQTLSLRDGILIQESDGMRVETLVDHFHDCVCIRVRSESAFSVTFREVADYPGKNAHWWDNYGGAGEEVEADWEAMRDGFVGRCRFPGGDSYCVSVRLDGRTSGASNTFHVTPENGCAHIYVAVATSVDGQDYEEQALRRSGEAARAGFARVRAEHLQDWHDFWSVNLLVLEDKFLENLFYLHQYLLRCGLGGRSNFGGMNPWHLGNQPWHGDMHVNINVQILWLSVFAINHGELANSFDSHFVAHVEDARKEARRFWGLPCLTYPFSSVGDLRPLHGGLWRYETYVSAWIAQVFWERYRFTGDEVYLREVCYPLQKEVLLFYENYIEKNREGQYTVPMSKPVEAQRGPGGAPFVRDMLLDIAALRQLLEAAIEASEKLGVDDQMRFRWRDILSHLVPLPADTDRQLFISYRGADPDLPNDHPTLLGPLYPSGLRLSDQEAEYAQNSLRHILTASRRRMEGFPFRNILAWGDDLSYAWICIAAARLGDREKVYRYLYDFLVLLQLKKNGLFSSCPSDISHRDRKVSLFNTVGGFTQAVTEMFLQSFDGLIRVFPAAPEGFSAVFAGLKASSNVTVDAAQADGRLLYIRLQARSDGTISLRNDWGEMRITSGGVVAATTCDPVIRVPVKAGEVCLITPQPGVVAEPLRFDTEIRSAPRTWAGPIYLEQLMPEQMWNITLGQ